MRQYLFVALVCAIPLFVRPSQARADLILSNLTGNDLGAFNGIGSGFAYSVGMTVGNDNLQLNEVIFRLKANGQPGNATVEVRSSVGNNPASTPLVTFNTQTIDTAGFSDYAFTPGASVTLQSNTTYWVTILNSFASGSGLVISAPNPATTPSGSVATYAGLRFGTPSNQSVNVVTLPAPNFQFSGDIGGSIGNITAVPEPTLCLAPLALGALGLKLLRDKRRRRVARALA